MKAASSATTSLAQRKCKACEGEAAKLGDAQISKMLKELRGWERTKSPGGEIAKTFKFKNYYETMAFVNAAAWVSHREDHHPDMEVGYNTCRVAYLTHAINGLSVNDFICAAKLDKLFEL